LHSSSYTLTFFTASSFVIFAVWLQFCILLPQLPLS
jgi:hypothetical protein